MAKGSAPSTPEPTASEIAAGSVAREQWNEYVDKWHKPVMEWAGRVGTEKAAATDERMLRGIGSADLAQANRSLRPASDPSHGRTLAGMQQAWGAAGNAGAGMATAARLGSQDNRIAALTQVANLGMGQKTQALAGINDVAQTSVTKAIRSAANDFSQENVNRGMVAGLGGTAAGVAYEYNRGKAAK
jgi:hypothetical protein